MVQYFYLICNSLTLCYLELLQTDGYMISVIFLSKNTSKFTLSKGKSPRGYSVPSYIFLQLHTHLNSLHHHFMMELNCCI